MTPELQQFVDRVVVPALVDRFLQEQAAATAKAARNVTGAQETPTSQPVTVARGLR